MLPTMVNYVFVWNSNTSLCFTELFWCSGTYELNCENPAFSSYWQAQMHQARSVERRKEFQSKTNTQVPQIWSAWRKGSLSVQVGCLSKVWEGFVGNDPVC